MNETDKVFDGLFRKVAFQNDEKAFRELFVEFYPALCVFAMRFSIQEEVAKDIVQDVFFKIWKNRKDTYITTSFRSFMITSVRNHCIDFLRRQKVESQFVEKGKRLHFNTSPEEVYTLKELESALGEALAKLPENVREAFEMSRFKGMTYSEIAQEMELSTKTIESYISRALKVLRVELGDYLPLLLLFL